MNKNTRYTNFWREFSSRCRYSTPTPRQPNVWTFSTHILTLSATESRRKVHSSYGSYSQIL